LNDKGWPNKAKITPIRLNSITAVYKTETEYSLVLFNIVKLFDQSNGKVDTFSAKEWGIIEVRQLSTRTSAKHPYVDNKRVPNQTA